MKDIKAAELKVLLAADHWAREVMREDRTLKTVETKLLDAVLYHLKIVKESRKKPVDIPRPPKVPSDLAESILHYPTHRYSEKITVPTPSGGFETNSDIENNTQKKDDK